MDDRKAPLLHDIKELKRNVAMGVPIPGSDIDKLASRVDKYYETGQLSPNAAYELTELVDLLKKKDADFSHNSLKYLETLAVQAINAQNEGKEMVEELNPESELPELNISSNDNITFLLGAGASEASGIPLVSDLLEEMVDQAKRTEDEKFTMLMKHCMDDPDIDVEDLLTAVYLSEFAVSEPSTLKLLNSFLFSEGDGFLSESIIMDDTPDTDPSSVNFIQDTIQTLFGSIASEMIPKNPNSTHEQIHRIVEDHENVSIITTNYDYCMDEQLLGEVNLDTKIDNTASNRDEKTVELFKLHGSINWTHCDNCQSVDSVPPEKVKEKFGSDSSTMDYPVIGICPICTGQRRPMLVPPTSFKFVQYPPLIDIRKGAKERLEQSDYIVPVGYSFSDPDAYIYKLVSEAMRLNDDTKMVIIDRNADELVEDLQSRFGAQLSEFDTGRVRGALGDSEKIMEDVADEMLNYED
jgi:NAD-dependent SIR2 family protein deacetylase